LALRTVTVGAGRLGPLAPRLARLLWMRVLLVTTEVDDAELSLDTLLVVLESLYDVHSHALRLTHIPAALTDDLPAALEVGRWRRSAAPRGRTSVSTRHAPTVTNWEPV